MKHMCKEKTITYNRTTQRGRLSSVREIPESEWCDFRRDYESGMTLKTIAEKYICDPRTVRRCILTNKPSADLGKQTEPTKLAAYADRIEVLFLNISHDRNVQGICDISRKITAVLKEEGYTGSEWTVRNYLRRQYQFVTDPDEPWEEI